MFGQFTVENRRADLVTHHDGLVHAFGHNHLRARLGQTTQDARDLLQPVAARLNATCLRRIGPRPACRLGRSALDRLIDQRIVAAIETELAAKGLTKADSNPDVFVVFDNGVAKRTSASEWTAKGRAGLGVLAAKSGKGGRLVGALVVDEDDEVMVVMEKGNIVRSAVAEVNRTSRNTQGVSFASPRKGDEIVAVARNVDRGEDAEPGDEQVASDPDVQSAGEVPAETAQQGDAPGGDQE